MSWSINSGVNGGDIEWLTVNFSFSVVEVHLAVGYLDSDYEGPLVLSLINEEGQYNCVVLEVVLELLDTVFQVIWVIQLSCEVSVIVHNLVLGAKHSG